MERVQGAIVMSPVEMQDAEQMVGRYTPAQVDEAIEYTREHATTPNWPYLKRVLGAKKHRKTMADYPSFDETTKAKLDRFRVAVTGLEKVLPATLPEYARRAIEG